MTAKDRFNQLCVDRWNTGAIEYGAEWSGRHPLWEMVEELADAMNYAMVAKHEDRAGIPKDLLLAVESLGTTVMTYVTALEERGMDPTAQWQPRGRVR